MWTSQRPAGRCEAAILVAATASTRARRSATPLIAGAQALWRQQNPAATPAAIAQALTDGARPLFDATSAPYPADAVGAGMVDVSVAP